MTCRDVAEFLADFLDKALAPEVAAAFEQHLRACPACRDYLHAYRSTVRAARAAWPATPDDKLADVPEELVRAILASRAQGDSAGSP